MKKKDRKDKLKYKNKIRKQQLSTIKTETKLKEDDCGISDESLARMESQMTEQYGAEYKMIRDKTLEKMSDIILEYGQPLIDTIDSDDKEEYKNAIIMTIILWNCAIIEAPPINWKKLKKELKPMVYDDESRSVVKYMLERKWEMFPDNKRIIMNYELNETPNGLYLSVASSIPTTKQYDNLDI